MTEPTVFEDLVTKLQSHPAARVLIAVSGPPASGKSRLAERFDGALNAHDAGSAAIVPMDGFHYDDAVLEAAGTLARKGAPFTFDVAGLYHTLLRLRCNDEPSVAVPVFDRALELSCNAARLIDASTKVVIVEGNYLLARAEPWASLLPLFDVTVLLTASMDELERRLTARWVSHGYDVEQRRRKVSENDLPNARFVLTESVPAQFVIRTDPPAR